MKIWDILMDIGLGYLTYRFLDYVCVSETTPVVLTIMLLSFFAELVELRPKAKGGNSAKPSGGDHK